MATSTVPNVLERFQNSAKAYLENIVSSIDANTTVINNTNNVTEQETMPVEQDPDLYKAIRALEALALPFSKTNNPTTNTATTEKTTKVVLELVQSLQHWRDLQLASVRALEKSMDPESSYAGNAKKIKTSENHSNNPVCEKLLIGIEEIFLNGVLGVLNGANPRSGINDANDEVSSGNNDGNKNSHIICLDSNSNVSSTPTPTIFGSNNDGTGTIVLLLEQSWNFFTDPPSGVMLNLFATQRNRCEILHSKVLGLISISCLNRITSRLLFGVKEVAAKAKTSADKTLAKEQTLAILKGLRNIKLGIENGERSNDTHIFLTEIIPYTMKKVMKDVKIRHVALATLSSVLGKLSKSTQLHLKHNQGRRLSLWTSVLEESCGAGSAVARATGKRKYKPSREYLWPVLTEALCCAPPEVFRLGVSQHIEHLVQTAQDPNLTRMALKCIQDTVEAFLLYHTTGAKSDSVFDVLQDTARNLICDNSPPKLNFNSMNIFAEIIQVVSKYNFDFAMLNMIVALIKQGINDSKIELAKQLKVLQNPKYKFNKHNQDSITPNFSWKIEVALVALYKVSEFRNGTKNNGTFKDMVGLYVDTLSDCFSFVCKSSFPFITNTFIKNRKNTGENTNIKWSSRDINIFQLTIHSLPYAFPIMNHSVENEGDAPFLSFNAISSILVTAEQLHPNDSVRQQALKTLLHIYSPKFCSVNNIKNTRAPTIEQICDGFNTIVRFIRDNRKTYKKWSNSTITPEFNQIVIDLPSERNGSLNLLNEFSTMFRMRFAASKAGNTQSSTLLNVLNENIQFKESILTVEAICINYLCGPDVRCYCKATQILEDIRVIRGASKNSNSSMQDTVCDAIDHAFNTITVYDAIASNNSTSDKVKEMVKETEKQENTIIGGINAGQINNSKSIKENNAFIGGWQFQRNWCTIIETFTRSLAPGKIHGNIEKENDDDNMKNNGKDTKQMLLEAFAMANAQRKQIQEDAILIGKSIHVNTHSKSSLHLIQQRMYRLTWWRNLTHFLFGAISIVPFEVAQELQEEFVHIMSTIGSFDAEHIMKHGSFGILCEYVSSNNWQSNASILMSIVSSALGGIPCTRMHLEALLNRLWDHEVDVLPEGGGNGERYDDDPADLSKTDGGSWTSKLLGRASSMQTQSMRRKIMQMALTSIFSKLAKRASIKVWCADVVQSRILSFIQKMRSLLEGRPRKYLNDVNGSMAQEKHTGTPRIPAILKIRNLYCQLVHDFCEIVNESDRVLGRQKESVLTSPIRAALFETCLEWCVGKPTVLSSRNGKKETINVTMHLYNQRRTLLHFASCDAMSVLVQGPPFEQAALKGGSDGFVWAWVDALLMAMPVNTDNEDEYIELNVTNNAIDIDAKSSTILPQEQTIANGAVKSILKSNPLPSVVNVLIERVHSASNTRFSHLTFGYLKALQHAFTVVLPDNLVSDEENKSILSSLLFATLLKCGHRNVKIRHAAFALMDTMFHLVERFRASQSSSSIDANVVADMRVQLRSLCCPSLTSPSNIDKCQIETSALVHSLFMKFVSNSAMVNEACLHMTNRSSNNNNETTFKLEHMQILDLLRPWTSMKDGCIANANEFNVGVFNEIIALSNLMVDLDETRCGLLWSGYLTFCSNNNTLSNVVSMLLDVTSEILRKNFIYTSMKSKSRKMIQTCKLAISMCCNHGQFHKVVDSQIDLTAALRTAISPWDSDIIKGQETADGNIKHHEVSDGIIKTGRSNADSAHGEIVPQRDPLKCDASIILTSALLPLPSSVLHSFLGRVMHVGARGIFSTSTIVRAHAKTLLSNCCRSMGRVDCISILKEMFQTIQHGDTAQNSKLALDGIVAALVGGREDEKEILGVLASELIGAAHLECLTLPQDGTASIKDMEDIRFSFLFYEVLAPRVSYQTNSLYKLALSLDQTLGVAVSKSLHKNSTEFNDTPHLLLIESIVNAISMTLETMPSEKMLLFPQIVWASVALMKPGTGNLFNIALKLMVRVFDKLNPVENSVMRDVVEACMPSTFKSNNVETNKRADNNNKSSKDVLQSSTNLFKGVLPVISIGIGRKGTDKNAFKLLSILLNAPSDMKYFVDKRTEKEIFIVLITLMMPTLATIYSCYDDEEQYNVVKNAFKMLHKYSTSSFDNEHISNVFENVLKEMEYDEKTSNLSHFQQTNTIKNAKSTKFIITLTECLLQNLLKDSKKLFNLFLCMQIHMINGDVGFYLPCCVTSLRFVFGLENNLIRGLLKMAGTQLLNNISDSLTNKLDGEMWEEILPMLHIIASTTTNNNNSERQNSSNNNDNNALQERLLQHANNRMNNRHQQQIARKQIMNTADSSDDDEEEEEKVIKIVKEDRTVIKNNMTGDENIM